jgi:hypothetical protein
MSSSRVRRNTRRFTAKIALKLTAATAPRNKKGKAMTAIKKADVSSKPLSFVSNPRAEDGRFAEAPSDEKLGENMTLVRHAPDVIRALGAEMTIAELRARSGMSVSKLAELPESERALVVDLMRRGAMPLTESFERTTGAAPRAPHASHPRPGTHRPHQRGTRAAHASKKHPRPKGNGAAGRAKHAGTAPAPSRKKPKKTLPPFSSGKRIGDVVFDGVAFEKRAISPQATELARAASTAKLIAGACSFLVPAAVLKAVWKHPKSVSVGPNGAAQWAKLKDNTKKWMTLMHAAVMASIEGGAQLSPRLDPNKSAFAVKRVAERRAALDLVGEIVRSKSSAGAPTLGQTKSAANELVRSMLSAPGQKAYEVVWQGPDGHSVRAIVAIDPKRRALAITTLTSY